MAIALLSHSTVASLAHEDMEKKLPSDLSNFKQEDYPHFTVWSAIQLGKAMDYDQVKENSRIIANLSTEDVKKVTFQQLEDMGVRIHGDSYWD